VGGARDGEDRHVQRMQGDGLGRLQPFEEAPFAIVIHQESHRSPVHAVDRHLSVGMLVQCFEHHAVAAEGHDDIGPAG